MSQVQSSGLHVTEVTKSFGSLKALSDVTFYLSPGSMTAILGPSGCGKSTLLHIIAGLETADKGDVFWAGYSLAHIPAHQRGFGLMFQDYALFPHLNVFENVSFGLHMARMPFPAMRQRVAEMLELVGLKGFEKRDVINLSGGEAQRVALARSLAPQPHFLMLDEPFGSLDRNLRERLTGELRLILHSLGLTSLYVTHDQEEAFALANYIIVMHQGQVVQMGAPQDIFQTPANAFVANFIGLRNLLSATGSGERAQTAIGWLPLPHPAHGPITLLIRPDGMHLAGTGAYQLEGVVKERIFLGHTCRAVIDIHGTSLSFDFPPQTCLPAEADVVRLTFNPATAIQIIPA